MTIDTVNATEVPSIPSTVGIADPGTARFLARLKELLAVRTGVAGDELDQWVTFRDLYDNGMLTLPSGQSSVRLPRYGSAVWLPAGAGPEFAQPPAVTHFTATAALANFILEWDLPAYSNHAYTEICRAGTDNLGAAVRVAISHGSMYADNVGTTGATRYYWVRNVSTANIAGPFNATAGTGGTTGKVGNSDLTDLIITSQKIAAGAIDAYVHFGTGIRPPGIGSALPTLPSATYPVGATFALTTDAKLYRVDTTGNAWTTAVPTVDLTGTIAAAQIANGAITLAKFSSGLGPVSIVGALPALPDSSYPQGAVVALTTDNKLYRSTGTTWTKATDGADIVANSITAAQIAAASITTTQIAAGTIVGTNIAANTITSSQIAANAITSATIAAGAVVAGKIGTGAIVAGDGVIANAAITNALIGALAVDTANIANGAIVNAKIGSLAVDAAKIADAAIGTAKIIDANITTLKVAGNAITFPYILAGTATTITSSATTILTTGSHTFGDGTASDFPVSVLLNVVLQNNTSSYKDDVTIELCVDSGGAIAVFYAMVDASWSTAPRTWMAMYKTDLHGSHYFVVKAYRSGSGGTLQATATLEYLETLR